MLQIPRRQPPERQGLFDILREEGIVLAPRVIEAIPRYYAADRASPQGEHVKRLDLTGPDVSAAHSCKVYPRLYRAGFHA